MILTRLDPPSRIAIRPSRRRRAPWWTLFRTYRSSPSFSPITTSRSSEGAHPRSSPQRGADDTTIVTPACLIPQRRLQRRIGLRTPTEVTPFQSREERRKRRMNPGRKHRSGMWSRDDVPDGHRSMKLKPTPVQGSTRKAPRPPVASSPRSRQGEDLPTRSGPSHSAVEQGAIDRESACLACCSGDAKRRQQRRTEQPIVRSIRISL